MPAARITPRTYPARPGQAAATVFDVELEQGEGSGLFKGSDDGTLTFETELKAVAYVHAHGFLLAD